MAQSIDKQSLRATHYPVTGSSGPPATPSSGQALVYGVGTSNIRPAYMNQTGTAEFVATTVQSAYPMMRVGTGVFSGSSSATITFGTAFPNSCDVVVITNGDTAANNTGLGVRAVTATNFVASQLSGGTAAVRYNYVAFGS